MVYDQISFPIIKNRPFYYSNFVSTLDGKVQVKQNWKEYWPIGSEADHATLMQLREYADCLIHGKNTALGHRTLDSLIKPEFRKARQKRKKNDLLPYVIIGSSFDASAREIVQNSIGLKPVLIIPKSGSVPVKLTDIVQTVELGQDNVELAQVNGWLHQQGYKHVLVEGGPTVMGEFLAASLIDEVFLTIVPKIFGNTNSETLTMVEGNLFAPKDVPKLELLSARPLDNEVYLRYRVVHA